MAELKTYYAYNKSTNDLHRYEVVNPNHKQVRNAIGGIEIDFDTDMREVFIFEDGILETDNPNEQEFLDCFVENKAYKCKNGRMFKPWTATIRFATEKKKQETGVQVQIKEVEKVVLYESQVNVMKLDELKDAGRRVGFADRMEGKTKGEIIEMLKDNGNII